MTDEQKKPREYKDLTDQQREEIRAHGRKIGGERGAVFYEEYCKDMIFAVIAGRLHFATFHPISMLGYTY
jgi:DNA invertase Pin-like site-specific DNA recombinase